MGASSIDAVVWGSFCCSGQHQETRQAKDHPKAAYEAWHTAWRYPFRARRDWQSQAHLHTTLNKSRDEKLEIVGVWPTYPFGKRACIMGVGPNPAAGVGNRTRCCAGSGGGPTGCLLVRPRIGPVDGVWDWFWVSESDVGCGSFCCSGQRQETRQAKDHPKAAYEAWHTAWRYPFRARRDWQSQAHLHTTLNKSRDEKLEIVGV